ncbi:hypothetical protein C8J57DRAFT_1490498 [Mycena rebaudengoi]|nr:hypothetical protein C8J57DRAFT_1490498 [Mycena rebaudengoi]
MDLADKQDVDRQRQVDWCVEAFQSAYEIIFGALEPHLDPSAMTTQHEYDYQGATPSSTSRNGTHEGSPSRFDRASTSLDFSLPEPTRINTTQMPGDKRKRAVSQEEARKRFRKFHPGSAMLRDVLYAETLKATGYANPETIPQLAEARAALKQGLRRTRQLALDQHFDVLEVRNAYLQKQVIPNPHPSFRQTFRPQNAPMEWEHTYHSLLTDDEVGKLRILQLACAHEEQYQLAGLIHHLLQVKFRHEYVLGHLLGAGFLDASQEERESSELWEVLDGSDIDWEASVVTAPAIPEYPERPAKRAKGKEVAHQSCHSEDHDQYLTSSPWESAVWEVPVHGRDNHQESDDNEHMGIAL